MTCTSCVPAFDRRSFLRFSLGAGAGLAAAQQPFSALAQQTVAKQASGRTAKSIIFLWMGGGPSQLDTWDPKPGRKTGGEFKAIDTSAKGVQISEHLPITAQQMKNAALIRTLTSSEGAHERGTYLMHTGMSIIPGQDFATLGMVVSYERGAKDFPLPHYIAMDPPAIPQSDVFGEDYTPFRISNAENPIPNIRRSIDASRDKDRAALLFEQDAEWDKRRQQKEVEKVHNAYVKSEDVMNTPLLKAFDYRSEPDALKKEYGGRFGTNCLLARRLVEAGCSFVEIGMGGWDTHADNFGALKRMMPDLDAGMGTLLKDLAQKNLLKETMVVWAGEFGRTPDINAGKGRDHWTKCYSVMLAGGGIQGGRVVGNTGPDGYEISGKPAPVANFFASVFKACGIDPDRKYDLNGRKVKYAYNGTPLAELF